MREVKRLVRRLEEQYDELVRDVGRTTERDPVSERRMHGPTHDFEEDEDIDEGRPFPEEWE